MLTRSAAVAAVLVCSGWFVYGARPEAVPHVDLSALPRAIGPWEGHNESPFDDETMRVLGVDAYANRTYTSATGTPVGVYVGYYASQRQGDTIHSPLNCLPGAGWQPVARSRVQIGEPGSGFVANRLIVQKGIERQVVLYWYYGRGRRVASEYANKAYLIVDAVRLNRTDGALVRLVTPMPRGRAATTDGERDALAFAALLQPHIETVLASAPGESR